MYIGMVRIRRFEERVAELVEQGEILCPTHLCIGQEGVAVGVCTALRQDDYVFGGHRSHGHYLAKGGNMDLLMAEMDRYLRIVDRLKEVALGYGKSPAQVALR
jgi:pyruvate dehydrogenase E1 component alpha subunit